MEQNKFYIVGNANGKGFTPVKGPFVTAQQALRFTADVAESVMTGREVSLFICNPVIQTNNG